LRNLNPVTSPEACTGPLAAFGDLVIDPVWLRPVGERVYGIGQRVQVGFWGGHPKNVFGTVAARRVDQLPTFLEVQRWTGALWETVRTDADWDTTFRWERVGLAASKVTIDWLPGPGTDPGTYRILHRGFALKAGGLLEAYQGESPTFEVRR
jgi:neutral ceramidase